jgi:hypothetical protein
MTEVAVIRQARNSLKIKEETAENIKKFLAVQVQGLFLLSGQEPDKKDVVLITREVYKDLEKKYKGLTLKEIEYIFEQGIRGEYGDNYGINVISINRWLKTYYHSEERKQALKEITFVGLPQQTEPTEQEKQAIREKMVEKAFAEFRKNGFTPDHGRVAYKYLDEMGLINFSDEEIKLMKEIAEKELAQEDKDERSIGAIIREITGNRVENRTKRIMINKYLQQNLKKE